MEQPADEIHVAPPKRQKFALPYPSEGGHPVDRGVLLVVRVRGEEFDFSLARLPLRRLSGGWVYGPSSGARTTNAPTPARSGTTRLAAASARTYTPRSHGMTCSGSLPSRWWIGRRLMTSRPATPLKSYPSWGTARGQKQECSSTVALGRRERCERYRTINVALQYLVTGVL